jgi:hypothetical protein
MVQWASPFINSIVDKHNFRILKLNMSKTGNKSIKIPLPCKAFYQNIAVQKQFPRNCLNFSKKGFER